MHAQPVQGSITLLGASSKYQAVMAAMRLSPSTVNWKKSSLLLRQCTRQAEEKITALGPSVAKSASVAVWYCSTHCCCAGVSQQYVESRLSVAYFFWGVSSVAAVTLAWGRTMIWNASNCEAVITATGG